MLRNRIANIEFAARKLTKIGVYFPIDKDFVHNDIEIIVSHEIALTLISNEDASDLDNTNAHFLASGLLDFDYSVFYDAKMVYNKPVIAIWENRGDSVQYVVFDAQPDDDEARPL